MSCAIGKRSWFAKVSRSSTTPMPKPAAVVAALATAMETCPPPKGRRASAAAEIGSTKTSRVPPQINPLSYFASLFRLKTILRGASFCITSFAAAQTSASTQAAANRPPQSSHPRAPACANFRSLGSSRSLCTIVASARAPPGPPSSSRFLRTGPRLASVLSLRRASTRCQLSRFA